MPIRRLRVQEHRDHDVQGLHAGTTEGIPVLIDSNWSLEQAVAVYEVLDDLRAQIW